MATFYLSSTYEDLKECREEVSKALRRMHHEVIGMEDYTAETRVPIKKCLEDVARCDIYLGIFAWRYGYIPENDNPQKKAITELEYLEAVRLNKGPLIFILDKKANWPGDRYADDEEESRRIKTLRKKLSANHIVSFFKDHQDLATQVIIAANHWLATHKPQHTPPPETNEYELAHQSLTNEPKPLSPPLSVTQELGHVSRPKSPPRPLPWKWYLLAAFMAIAGVLFLTYIISTLYQPRRPITESGPPPYPIERKYDFFLTEKETLPATWHLVPGSWSLEKGEGKEENDGALLIRGSQMAIPKDLGGRAFYDHTADLKVRFKEGDRAGWVLWAQDDGQSGYLFELKKAGGTVFLKGWVLKNNRIGNPLPGDKPLIYSRCCNQTDALHVIADVTNDMTGTHIKYHITYRSDPGYATKDTATPDDAEFVDSKSTFKWGSIGLLVSADTTSPQASGVMKVEHVYLTPHGEERGSARESPHRSAP
jgi:hypothetical protein